ncbi:hypothetical protein FB446DRAFT_751461 [Lentinula raphanica]|nr:hypothetical protein FB446DRAFT_751461 [Lentinula raphanica]
MHCSSPLYKTRNLFAFFLHFNILQSSTKVPSFSEKMEKFSPDQVMNSFVYCCNRAIQFEGYTVMPWAFDAWYKDCSSHFNGEEAQFETWFWQFFYNRPSPEDRLRLNFPIRPVTNVDKKGSYPCYFFDCEHSNTKPFLSKQSRNVHFKSVHLGKRFLCPNGCGDDFAYQYCAKRHSENSCKKRREGV